jgi:ParB-like chromosome segregation protein Spo0J
LDTALEVSALRKSRGRLSVVGHGKGLSGNLVRNLDLQIERWPLDRLIPSDVNPRTHTREQVAQIAASIWEFGFINPILVGADGGIIAGEGRLRAARTEGMHEVPVIVLDHLSEVQRRALVIADNQLALNAGWDEQMLREQLAALQDQDFNLDLLGFDDQELARQLAEQEAAAGLTDEDEVPDVPITSVTRLGDLWLLGPRKGHPQHRVLCGDATASKATTRLLAGEQLPFLMVTDPPYGVDLEPEWREQAGLNPRTRQGGKVANDDRIRLVGGVGAVSGRRRLRLACRHSRRRGGAGPADLRIQDPVPDHLGEAALRDLTRRLPLAA